MLLGVALVRDKTERTPALREAEVVMYECLRRGLSFKVSGGNFLTLTPPLTISDGEMEQALAILDESLTTLWRRCDSEDRRRNFRIFLKVNSRNNSQRSNYTHGSYASSNPYLLLTPGPLSTSKSVRASMLRDWCTWDADYNNMVQELRKGLVRLATARDGYTAVLMQGSGTFSVESVIGSAIPEQGKLLVLANGHYGDRIAKIANRLRIPVTVDDSGEVLPPDLDGLKKTLQHDSAITHVAVVHCETTTGMLNPVEQIG